MKDLYFSPDRQISTSLYKDPRINLPNLPQTSASTQRSVGLRTSSRKTISKTSSGRRRNNCVLGNCAPCLFAAGELRPCWKESGVMFVAKRDVECRQMRLSSLHSELALTVDPSRHPKPARLTPNKPHETQSFTAPLALNWWPANLERSKLLTNATKTKLAESMLYQEGSKFKESLSRHLCCAFKNLATSQVEHEERNARLPLFGASVR
jgi:hypothetical protein